MMMIQALFIRPMTFGMSMPIQMDMEIQILVFRHAISPLDLWKTTQTVTT